MNPSIIECYTLSPCAVAISGHTAWVSAPSSQCSNRHKFGSAQQIGFSIGSRYTCGLAEIWVAEDAASMLWAELRRPLWKVWSRLDGYCTSCITLCNVLEDIRNLTWAFRDGLGSWKKAWIVLLVTSSA